MPLFLIQGFGELETAHVLPRLPEIVINHLPHFVTVPEGSPRVWLRNAENLNIPLLFDNLHRGTSLVIQLHDTSRSARHSIVMTKAVGARNPNHFLS